VVGWWRAQVEQVLGRGDTEDLNGLVAGEVATVRRVVACKAMALELVVALSEGQAAGDFGEVDPGTIATHRLYKATETAEREGYTATPEVSRLTRTARLVYRLRLALKAGNDQDLADTLDEIEATPDLHEVSQSARGRIYCTSSQPLTLILTLTLTAGGIGRCLAMRCNGREMSWTISASSPACATSSASAPPTWTTSTTSR
jgi:hypothetical protein